MPESSLCAVRPFHMLDISIAKLEPLSFFRKINSRKFIEDCYSIEAYSIEIRCANIYIYISILYIYKILK